MQFNSFIFILGFLPLFVIGFYLIGSLKEQFRILYLVAASALFYAWCGLTQTIILAVSIVWNYVFSLAISMTSNKAASDAAKTTKTDAAEPAAADTISGHMVTGSNGKVSTLLLIINIAGNVGLLFYFKYYDFFMSTVHAISGQTFTARNNILPLGVSFFTFQQIMYAVNLYQGKINKPVLLDYLAYVLYFPKITMGPLVEPAGLISQFHGMQKKLDWDRLSCGLKLFSFGLFKKVILADTFASAVSWGYGHIGKATSMDWFLIMLSYTFEIYFDFSGYCDMGAGISEMIGIRLPANFDSPYKALSIRDFWKRWHITLTGFLTRYIYIPLGGSRRGRLRTYLNTMIVFLISGLWHGAAWTFILWGLLHGLLSIYERIFEKWQSRLHQAARWMATFLSVNLLWLLFRSETISQWLDLLKTMFTFQDMSVSQELIQVFMVPEFTFLFDLLRLNDLNAAVRGLAMLIFLVFSFIICLVPDNNYESIFGLSRVSGHNNTYKTKAIGNNIVQVNMVQGSESQNKETEVKEIQTPAAKVSFAWLIPSAIALIWSFLCLSGESVFLYFDF